MALTSSAALGVSELPGRPDSREVAYKKKKSLECLVLNKVGISKKETKKQNRPKKKQKTR